MGGTVGGPDGRVFGGNSSREKDSPRQIMKMLPVGRFGSVHDIANTAIFCASPAGSFINATHIVVDGGHHHEASSAFLKGKDFVHQKSVAERKNYKGGVKKSKL